MNIINKLFTGGLLVIGATVGTTAAHAGLHVYSVPFGDTITVRVFDHGQPVNSGSVRVYNPDGRELQTVNITNGKAMFHFPVLGTSVKIVATSGAATGVTYQSRENRLN